MSNRASKAPAKPITVTVERLSDNSRITFTISSDKKIAHLRSLLNHHLPPSSPNKFHLYSFQRGAFIHYHPPSFKLDYFPVIFDQSVLLLKMDDRDVNSNENEYSYEEVKQPRWFFERNPLPSNTRRMKKSSSTNVTCLSMLKQIFRQPGKSLRKNMNDGSSVLTY